MSDKQWLAARIRDTLKLLPGDGSAVERFRRDVRGKFEERFNKGKGNLCVHSESRGGVLHVPNRRQEVGAFAACNEKTLSTEWALIRALFNTRFIALSSPRKKLAAIAFEAPLLRKARGEKGEGHRILACDLVYVLGQASLLVVEVKDRTATATNIDYGLLEAVAYGQLLKCLGEQAKDDLWAEVKDCRVRYQPSLSLPVGPPDGKSPIQVQISLAGTRRYFDEQLAGSRRNVKLSRERARGIEQALAGSDFPFYGYLVIESRCLHENPFRLTEQDRRVTCFLPTLKTRAARCFGSLRELERLQAGHP